MSGSMSEEDLEIRLKRSNDLTASKKLVFARDNESLLSACFDTRSVPAAKVPILTDGWAFGVGSRPQRS